MSAENRAYLTCYLFGTATGIIITLLLVWLIA